jgi:hypothetical protein
MTDTPKDKTAAALERIKALSSKRSSSNAGGVDPRQASSGGGPKRAPKHGGGVAHRPQGG